MRESDGSARNKNCDIDEVCLGLIRFDTAKERIGELEDRPTEIQTENKEKKVGRKTEQSIQELWNNI